MARRLLRGGTAALALATAAVAGLMASATAQTQTPPVQIYSCEDAQGRTISSDRPIADCARREMRVLNRDGSLRKVIPPPLTRDQRKAAERAALERQDELARLRARQARDRSLLITFEDEASLEAMRSRQVAEVDSEIEMATKRILTLDRELKTAQGEAARFQTDNQGRNLPFAFQQRITDAANAILAEDSLIRDRQNERDRINERFDEDAARLRVLLGVPAAPPAASVPARDDDDENPAPTSLAPTPVTGQVQARALR